jgi:G3E family GTPase
LNKTDLVSEADKVRIKRTIRQLNKRAEIIETFKSNVDLKKVLNTGRFDFYEAAKNTKWLVEDRYQINPETEEYGVGSFVYEPKKPF